MLLVVRTQRLLSCLGAAPASAYTDRLRGGDCRAVLVVAYSTAEAPALAGVLRSTLQYWARTGLLPLVVGGDGQPWPPPTITARCGKEHAAIRFSLRICGCGRSQRVGVSIVRQCGGVSRLKPERCPGAVVSSGWRSDSGGVAQQVAEHSAQDACADVPDRAEDFLEP